MREFIDSLHAEVPIYSEKPKTGESDKAKASQKLQEPYHEFAETLEQKMWAITTETIHAARYIVCHSHTKRDIIDSLAEEAFNSTFDVRDELSKNRKNRPDGEQKDRFVSASFALRDRLKKIRPRTTVIEGKSDEEKAEILFDDVSNFGISNIAINSYSYFDVIPGVFYRTYGRDPEPKEQEEIAETTLNNIRNAATSHDHVFKALYVAMRRQSIDIFKWKEGEKNVEFDFFLRPFHESDFELEGTNLVYTSRFMECVRERVWKSFLDGEINISEPRVGCAGMKCFPVLFKRCLRLAHESMFLYPKLIRTLPRSRGQWPHRVAKQTAAKPEKKLILPSSF